MVWRILTSAAAAAVTLTMATACDNGGGTTAAPAPVPSASVAAPTTTAPSTPSPAASVSESTPPKPVGKLRRGDKGPEVVALQQRLTELGYWNGKKADGTFGATTQQAVFALQKTAGLGRDGVVGPKTAKALERGVRPTARSKTGHVIEIDKKKQLLLVVQDGAVTGILNTSTGSNQTYEYKDHTYLAHTPSGKFQVSRQIDGWRHGPLGPLYRPKYFNGGIAVHGAYSIPPYPASHGCARLSIPAMDWLWSSNQLPLKTKVWVY
ncbi:L,D-transpeptidase family protein [Krasilnikovia sp. MM14-A1004]|uniref:L,D-transpeptidase family protein n=1 Tax=Krasilnikovia sp. MM14-A1004 TaxID=3373541 RepID=UPI00399C957C